MGMTCSSVRKVPRSHGCPPVTFLRPLEAADGVIALKLTSFREAAPHNSFISQRSSEADQSDQQDCIFQLNFPFLLFNLLVFGRFLALVGFL